MNLQRGVATIPIILVFGILTVAIAIGLTALSFSENLSSHGSYNASRALRFAEAGARDALERIARDKNYACVAPDCYALDMATSGCSTNAACARVSVSAGVGTTSDPKIISSTGRSGVNIRELEVRVLFDSAAYGAIASTTWQEITN